MLTVFVRSFVFGLSVGAALLFPQVGWAQVNEYLKAPVVPSTPGDNFLVVQTIFSNSAADVPIAIRRIDNQGEPHPIDTDAVILTRTQFQVAYYRYNPLRVGVTVQTKDIEDPGHAALISLLDAIKKFGISRELVPDAQKGVFKSTCDADQILSDLETEVATWTPFVDTAFLTPGTASGSSIMKELDQRITVQVEAISSCQNKIAVKARTQTDALNLRDGSDLGATLKAASQSLILLKETLKPTLEPARWVGPHKQAFIVSDDIKPTTAKAKATTITISVLSIAMKENALTATTKGSTPFTLTARHLWTLLPAISGGMVVGFVDRPKYSVKQNEQKQNIVSLDGYDSHRLDAAVMCNFVPHIKTGSIAPLLQAGVSTSSTLPALLAGAGFRLFGLPKGDFGIGGGLMVGWYKDLDKLHVGDVVSGSDDLTNDLRFRKTPKASGYLTIQYSF